ncbi:MAG TPA: glycosyltransferase family 4 protein [Acidimicrobiales bacterium]|nr:glycosyltransferase family 4 protein [Acidimicrobiales bacterium]
MWLLTPSHNREAIEAGRSSQVTFVYADVPGWPADSGAAARIRRTHYNLWQLRILATAKRMHRQLGFDVVHHLTYAQYWTGSWMGRLRIPFVWGPVGGGESAPASVIEMLPPEGRRFERNRDLARWVGRRSPAVRSAARTATLTLATTEESKRAVETLQRRDYTRRGVRKPGTTTSLASSVAVLSNCALPESELDALAPSTRSTAAFRVLCVGRLEHWKGFQFAIQAFASLLPEVPHAELHIVGTGPAESFLRDLVASLRLERNVHFVGPLPRPEVLERLAESHVLVHPSLHDSAGWATLEASAVGLPVVCLDIGGPALQVTDETGIKVPVEQAHHIVPLMAKALTRLARDPQLASRLGAAGRRRVEANFTWNRIGDQLATMVPYKLSAC